MPLVHPVVSALILGALAAPAVALTLDIPGDPVATHAQTEGQGSYALPIGPTTTGVLPVRIGEGQVTRLAFRIDTGGLSALQLIAPLRDQLQAEGFAILLDCATAACGGFDFRFATEVIAPPDMHVDLGDFHFVSAARAGDWPELIGVLASRTASAGFVQIIRVGPPDSAPLTRTDTAALIPADPVALVPSTPPPEVPAATGDFGTRLETDGRVVLDGLAFPTGSAQLAEGRFASMDTLAAYLLANPDRKVALVGHTDSEGSLEGNIALSRRRAGSVLERLASDYGVPGAQMEADGMGYLAPLTSNLTPEGRERNRRVEVILTSTE